MLNPKELFRHNATVKGDRKDSASPKTGTGTDVPPPKDGLDRFLENKAAFEANSNSTVITPAIDAKAVDTTVQLAINQTRTAPFSPVHEKEVIPAPPTEKDIKDANSGKSLSKTENAILRFAKKHPVVTVGSTLAAIAGGFAAVEAAQGNIPGVHRSVDVPQSFDKNATEGVVGPRNILIVPKEVFDKIPIADAQGNPIFDFPWDPNHPLEIRYHKEALRDDQIAWLKSGGLVNADDYKGYETDMYSDNSLPAGFEFPAIYPGRLFFMGSVWDEEASRKSPSNPYGLAAYSGPITMATIEFIAPNGILYFINIQIIKDSGGVEENLPILPLIDAPLINPENRNGQDWEKGTPVEGLQKIFSATQKGKLKMTIQGGLNGRLDGPNAERVPGTFKFKTATDASGIQKIPLPEPK